MAKRRVKAKPKSRQAPRKSGQPKAGAKKRPAPRKPVQATAKKAKVLKKPVKSGAAKGQVSGRRINPGDIPFTKLTFNNKRSEAFDAKVSAVDINEKTYGPLDAGTIPITPDGGTGTSWTPPSDWVNLMQVTVQVDQSDTDLGDCPADVAVSVPQVYPSEGTFTLNDFTNDSSDDSTLELVDDEDNEVGSGTAVIDAAPTELAAAVRKRKT